LLLEPLLLVAWVLEAELVAELVALVSNPKPLLEVDVESENLEEEVVVDANPPRPLPLLLLLSEQ
jgi:hypothetical protein